MTIGFVSGTYGPVTNGHLSMIVDALDVVDRLIVCVADNPGKSNCFSAEKRKSMVEESIQRRFTPDEQQRITVITNSECDQTYTVRLAQAHGASVVFRGIRDVKDFEYERQLATVNRTICPYVTTVFLLSKPEEAVISSSLVMSQLGYTGWQPVVARWVPAPVLDVLVEMVEQGWWTK